MAYFRAAMELAFCPLRADGSYRTKGGSDMGEDGTFGAWQQIRHQLDVVEACARELDPQVCGRVVALRQQVDGLGSQPHHESARGDDESARLSEIVQGVQDVVRHLREILAAEGAVLTTSDAPARGQDAAASAVAGRRRMLIENAEKLFRVSNTMWDVLRSVE